MYPAFSQQGLCCDTRSRILTSRVDYCNAVFAAAPKVTTNKLQRVLNAAARVVMAHGSLIAACLSCFTLNFIVKYKVSVMVHRCLNGCAPQYLAMYYVPVSSIAARQHLCSAVRHQLAVPSHCLNRYGHRAFAIAGLTTWNSLPTHLYRAENGTTAFGRLLKTHLFSE